MIQEFGQIFTNINLNLHIVETRRFISDLRKGMENLQSDPRLLSALNGDMNSQREFIAYLSLGRVFTVNYDFYLKWIRENWEKYRF